MINAVSSRHRRLRLCCRGEKVQWCLAWPSCWASWGSACLDTALANWHCTTSRLVTCWDNSEYYLNRWLCAHTHIEPVWFRCCTVLVFNIITPDPLSITPQCPIMCLKTLCVWIYVRKCSLADLAGKLFLLKWRWQFYCLNIWDICRAKYQKVKTFQTWLFEMFHD